MRDDKYWEEASVNTIIMGEKIVLNYEKELEIGRASCRERV